MNHDNLIPAFGEAYYYPDFLTKADADAYMERLTEESDWQEAEIRMFGKMVKIPRLQAWYGTKQYSYSGLMMEPLPLTETLIEIKSKVEELAQASYNLSLIHI